MGSVTDFVLSPVGLVSGVGAGVGFVTAGPVGAGLGFAAVLGAESVLWRLGYI